MPIVLTRRVLTRRLFAGSALLAIGGCRVERPAVDPAAMVPGEPRLAAARAEARVETYRTADGAELAYTAYRSADIPADTAIILLHGLDDHGGWLALMAARLAQTGSHVYCPDRRGAGANREHRGFASGDAADADQLLSDVGALVATLRRHYPKVVLGGWSWGGKLALAQAASGGRPVDALVLLAPRLTGEAGDGGLLGAGRSALARLRTGLAVPIAIPVESLTADPAWREALSADPLRLEVGTSRLLAADRELDARIEEGIAGLALPILAVLGGKDQLVAEAPTLDFLRRAERAPLTVATQEGAGHALMLEAPEAVAAEIAGWLGQPPSGTA